MTTLPFSIHGYKVEDTSQFDEIYKEGVSMIHNPIHFPDVFPLVLPAQLETAYCPFCGHEASQGGMDVRLLVTEPFDNMCQVSHAAYCDECKTKTVGVQQIKRVSEGIYNFRHKQCSGEWVSYQVDFAPGFFKGVRNLINNLAIAFKRGFNKNK